MQKRRYAIVGTGSRARMYLDALSRDYTETCDFVAICDRNPGRLEAYNHRRRAEGLEPLAAYPPEEFDTMLEKEEVDRVVVVSGPDSTHAGYICRSLDAGRDVISEKPMVTTVDDALAVRRAVERSGQDCQVTFNLRYQPVTLQIKEIIHSGAVGEIYAADMGWYLDTEHGADYFRRWHRMRANSGSLLVHKSTHHFDLVNWWLADRPKTVYARGSKRYYVPATAERLGLNRRTERCLTCPHRGECPVALDISTDEKLTTLYLDHESHDGYFRDRCVFDPAIDIWDTMALTVEYAGGAIFNYLLTAYNPTEGYAVDFSGNRGRLEFADRATEFGPAPAGSSVPEPIHIDARGITLRREFAGPESITPRTGEGGHGGGDPRLLDDLFGQVTRKDSYTQQADYLDGIYSCIIGIAAELSIDSGTPVDIEELLRENILFG